MLRCNKTCLCCSNKIESRPPLQSPHLVGFVLFLAIVEGSQWLDQIHTKERCFHLWFCFMMYSHLATNYQHEHFLVSSNVVENNFAIITQDYIIGLNNNMEKLFYVWLVTIIQLTFTIYLFGLTNLCAKVFSKHPSCKWKVCVLFQLICLSMN